MTVEVNNKIKAKINISLVKKISEKFLQKYRLTSHEVSIAFVSDQRIRELNRCYRHQDKITDVLSFAGEDKYLGEIIIDYRQIVRQAKRYDKTIKAELIFILVHGLLHLSGYNDDTEVERLKMIKRGEKFVKELKI